MGPRDTFNFDEAQYETKLRDPSTSTRALIRKHRQKVMLKTSNKVVTFTGLAAALPTAGITLIGSSYAARQWDVLDQQKDLIEAELRRRGEPVPRERDRDIAAGMTLGAVSFAGTMVLPGVMDAAAGVGMNSITAANSFASTAAMPASDMLTMAHGALQGVQATIDNQSANFTGATADWTTTDCAAVPNAAAISAGASIGIHGITAVEAMALNMALQKSGEAVFKPPGAKKGQMAVDQAAKAVMELADADARVGQIKQRRGAYTPVDMNTTTRGTSVGHVKSPETTRRGIRAPSDSTGTVQPSRRRMVFILLSLLLGVLFCLWIDRFRGE